MPENYDKDSYSRLFRLPNLRSLAIASVGLLSICQASSYFLDDSTSMTTEGTNSIDLDLTPEDHIPPEINSFLAQNTVLISTVLKDGNLGCSGLIISEPAISPAIVMTAEHCGLRGTQLTRVTSSNGEVSFLAGSSQPSFMTGNDEYSMTRLDPATEWLLPSESDIREDVAFATIGGNGLAEAVSKIDFAGYPEVGDVAYMSGWPVELGGLAVEENRQTFVMTYLESHVDKLESGEHIHLLWYGIRSSDDTIICSEGTSGAVAIDSQGKLIGVLSAFYDFRDDPAANTVIENSYGFDVFCGIAQPPKNLGSMDSVSAPS